MGTFSLLSKALLRPLMLGLSVLALAGGLAGVALGQGRHAILIDIEPKYVEIARRRIANTTGPLFKDAVPTDCAVGNQREMECTGKGGRK